MQSGYKRGRGHAQQDTFCADQSVCRWQNSNMEAGYTKFSYIGKLGWLFHGLAYNQRNGTVI